MKWLLATLVVLNLIVFAGMIAIILIKRHLPVANVPQQQPIVVNISPNEKIKFASDPAISASSVTPPAQTATTPTTNNTTSSSRRETRNNTRTETRSNTSTRNNDNRRTVITNANLPNNNVTVRSKYKECSARVSMPEDDYHRIKGLLGRYPHAASRQVVDNGDGASAARMNVVFMQVNDQEASAIQGIVGRYGQLNRSACNR